MKERADGTIVVEDIAEMREREPHLSGIMDMIMKGGEGENIDFVLIRAVTDARVNPAPLIQMMSSLDVQERLNLIFTQLRRDLGPEGFRDVVRQLAMRELTDMAMTGMMASGRGGEKGN